MPAFDMLHRRLSHDDGAGFAGCLDHARREAAAGDSDAFGDVLDAGGVARRPGPQDQHRLWIG